MTAISSLWLLSSFVGLSVLLWVLLRPLSDPEADAAIRRSGMAGLPSLLPVVASTTGFCTRCLFVLGSLGGFAFLVASFLDAPYREFHGRWQVARLTHIVAWTCGSIVAVTMLLDG